MKKERRRNRTDRIIAILCVVLLFLAQVSFVVPTVSQFSHAAKAGEELDIVIHYFGGSVKDGLVKKTFSADELAGLPGADVYYYKNINRMGNVMNLAAYGPPITSVIENAGIDLNSVKRISFLAADGYSADGQRGFEATLDWYLQERYYYPNLRTRNGIVLSDDKKNLIIEEGVLNGESPVPIILAVQASSSDTGSDADLEELAGSMTGSRMFRLCIGQHKLVTGENDFSSAKSSYESIHSIDTIEVTLDGSPVRGMNIEEFNTKLKVGSKKKLNVIFSGDAGFEDLVALYGKNLKWKSDRPDIVSVDKNGEITVHKEGKATITVTAKVGDETIQASVTINGEGKKKNNAASTKDKSSKEKQKAVKKKETKKDNNTVNSKSRSSTNNQKTAAVTKKTSSGSTQAEATRPKKMITVREVSLSELAEIQGGTADVVSNPIALQQASDDAQAMGETRQFGFGAAAGTGAGALIVGGAGAVLRIRRFNKDIM